MKQHTRKKLSFDMQVYKRVNFVSKITFAVLNKSMFFLIALYLTNLNNCIFAYINIASISVKSATSGINSCLLY